MNNSKDYDNPTRYDPTVSAYCDGESGECDAKPIMDTHPQGDYVSHSAYEELLGAFKDLEEKLSQIAGIAS